MLIGKEGEQGFPIQNKFVSRKHCFVEYDPYHRMYTVRDNNSSNGTWIIDLSNGIDEMAYHKVSNVAVPPGTWLNLGGTETGQGLHFLVDHVSQADPNDFSKEFYFINDQYRRYQDRLLEIQEDIKNKAVRMNIFRVIFTLIIMGLLYLIMYLVDAPQGLSVGVMVVSGGVSGCIITMLTNKDKNKKALQEAKKNAQAFFLCPKCGRPLNEYSINTFECMGCKAR